MSRSSIAGRGARPRRTPEPPPAVRDQDAAAKTPPPELPPVEKLTFDSDYRAFFHPKVSEDTRRAALKKLFSDPRFNVMDGLDVYIDDYSKTEPIPPAMLAGLRQAQKILEWAKGGGEGGAGRPRQVRMPSRICHPPALEPPSTPAQVAYARRPRERVAEEQIHAVPGRVVPESARPETRTISPRLREDDAIPAFPRWEGDVPDGQAEAHLQLQQDHAARRKSAGGRAQARRHAEYRERAVPQARRGVRGGGQERRRPGRGLHAGGAALQRAARAAAGKWRSQVRQYPRNRRAGRAMPGPPRPRLRHCSRSPTCPSPSRCRRCRTSPKGASSSSARVARRSPGPSGWPSSSR